MKNLKELIVLGRFHFVLGGLLLYTLGYLLAVSAGISFSMDLFLWGYAILFFAHLSVHYSNDFFDAKGDRISKPTLFSGGSGVLVKHRQGVAADEDDVGPEIVAQAFESPVQNPDLFLARLQTVVAALVGKQGVEEDEIHPFEDSRLLHHPDGLGQDGKPAQSGIRNGDCHPVFLEKRFPAFLLTPARVSARQAWGSGGDEEGAEQGENRA